MAPLLNHSNHISKNLITEAVEVHHAQKLKPPHHSIKPLIERAGFSDVVSVGSFKIIPALVTAMVERWRPETHTFHLPVGECTITLQDVAMLLGLPVDGKAVTTSTQRNWTQLCVDLLGKPIPEEALVGKQIKFTWLEREFEIVPEGASNRQLKQHCRAYLLQLIGGVILPDKSSNRVHMKYLPLLEKIDQIKDYSWGSACLTNLYRMLCTTSTSTKQRVCMGGCTLLLQSWVWTRLPFLAPMGALPYGWPIAKR